MPSTVPAACEYSIMTVEGKKERREGGREDGKREGGGRKGGKVFAEVLNSITLRWERQRTGSQGNDVNKLSDFGQVHS